MSHAPYGPRGAESEREDFWTDIPEGGDMLPGGLPGDPYDQPNGDPYSTQSGTEPYCPQCPNADDPALQPDSDHNDTGLPEELAELDRLDDRL